jgi:hypothetical protein
VPFEQTLVFGGDNLTAVGSKTVPAQGGASGSTTTMWTERLTKSAAARL